MENWEHKVSTSLSALRLDSVRNKILAFAMLATLIPSLATTCVSYSQNKRSLTQKNTEELQNLSAQAAREADQWLQERFSEMRVFASSYEVSENIERMLFVQSDSTDSELLGNRLGDYLSSIQIRFHDFEDFLVIDPQSALIANTGVVDGTGLPKDWLRTVMTTETAIGKAYWDSSLTRTVMPIAVPIKAADEHFLGALTATLNLTGVDRILRRYAPGSGGEMYVMMRDGTSLTTSRTGSSQLIETSLPTTTADKLFDDTATSVDYADPNGRSVVGTLARVPDPDWGVVAQIPAQEAYAPVARLRNVTVVMLLALLFGVGLIAYSLVLIIVRPLNRLSEGASQVAGGNLDVDLPVLSGGEVGYLTQVFNDMVMRLRTGREALDYVHESLRQKNEELERISVTDGLTGLYNRRHLMESLQHEVSRSQRRAYPLSIIMIDVDHFKKYNDTHGHLAGDEVLKRLAKIMKECVRDVDSPARYGGEEFLIVLPDATIDGASEVAERIRQRVEAESFEVNGKSATVTLSIGAAEFSEDGSDPEKVIASADAALYRAKRGGRNRVTCARFEAKKVSKKKASKRKTSKRA